MGFGFDQHRVPPCGTYHPELQLDVEIRTDEPTVQQRPIETVSQSSLRRWARKTTGRQVTMLHEDKAQREQSRDVRRHDKDERRVRTRPTRQFRWTSLLASERTVQREKTRRDLVIAARAPVYACVCTSTIQQCAAANPSAVQRPARLHRSASQGFEAQERACRVNLRVQSKQRRARLP